MWPGRGSTRGSIESTNENPTASDRCRREGLPTPSRVNPSSLTRDVVYYLVRRHLICPRCERASLLSLFYKFYFVSFFFVFHLWGCAWPRPVTDHPSKIQLGLFSFFPHGRETETRSSQKTFWMKGRQNFIFQKHTHRGCKWKWEKWA